MARRGTALFLGLGLLAASGAGFAGGAPQATPAQRGRGALVGPVEQVTTCQLATYTGADTPLYSNRPYRTTETVPALANLRFCRGARHGTDIWTLEVLRATELLALAGAVHALPERGWSAADVPVLVEAAGVPLDRLYRKRFEPGRYLIRQAFARTAIVVFWSPEDARITD